MSKRKSFSSSGLTRRQFIYTSTLAASALSLSTFARPSPRRLSPGEKLNIASVGVGGKGESDLGCVSEENIVALCDVDQRTLDKAHAKYPNANTYKDFRKMLEKEKSIDAVMVSTPDHCHAIVAATAIKMGKHVYCQKPLTQTVYEARLLRKLAKEYGVATQMGNQGSAEDGLRRSVEVVQAGLIGSVSQVHVWSNRPIWPQGMDRPPGEDPVPAYLDWDLWLGPAKSRPYKGSWPAGHPGKETKVYHDFVWRGWQDFGTGALGDMACHTCNMPFRALKLGYPTEVEAHSSPINQESYPLKSTIRFEFPAREGLAPLTFYWHDGGDPLADDPYRHNGNNKPPADVTAAIREARDSVPGSGCLLIGSKGQLFSPDDYGAQFFIKLKDDKELTDGRFHEAVKAIPQTIPRNEFYPKETAEGGNGQGRRRRGDPDRPHHLEWIAACKGGKPGYSNFDIAAYLTEIILLGCVSLRTGKKLEWDGQKMAAKNAPEAAHFIRRENRKGWTV
jgi:predicted dehydrogenase